MFSPVASIEKSKFLKQNFECLCVYITIRKSVNFIETVMQLSGALDGARTRHFIARGCFLCCFIASIAVVSATMATESYGGCDLICDLGHKRFAVMLQMNHSIFTLLVVAYMTLKHRQ